MTRQNCYNLAGKFWFIQCIHYIAPSDVHLFQFLQTSLTGKNINSLEDCKSHLKQFFVQKGKFGEDGIMYEVAWKMAEGTGTKACASSSPAFLMIYSAYKLNKQGDNIQPWRTPFPIWNQSVVPCPVLTVASWPAYRFLKRQWVEW